VFGVPLDQALLAASKKGSLLNIKDDSSLA
jgi:hypothetical protein